MQPSHVWDMVQASLADLNVPMELTLTQKFWGMLELDSSPDCNAAALFCTVIPCCTWGKKGHVQESNTNHISESTKQNTAVFPQLFLIPA